MHICPHAIRVLEKNSSFRTKDPSSPPTLKNGNSIEKTAGQSTPRDGTTDREKETKKRNSMSIEEEEVQLINRSRTTERIKKSSEIAFGKMPFNKSPIKMQIFEGEENYVHRPPQGRNHHTSKMMPS